MLMYSFPIFGSSKVLISVLGIGEYSQASMRTQSESSGPSVRGCDADPKITTDIS